MKTAVVIGVGPGLGAAVARRFAREGFRVALMARNMDKLQEVRTEIENAGGQAMALETDAVNEQSVSYSFQQVRDQWGDPEVLIYNVGAFRIQSLLDTSPEDFVKCWQLNCHGAFLCSREVLPAMQKVGRGTILLTSATAALRGSARFACLAVGKFGARALSQSMAREFGPQGIHIASVIVDGLIDTPRVREMFPEATTKLDPDAIADSYWHLYCQDRSAWTQELDLRPAEEQF